MTQKHIIFFNTKGGVSKSTLCQYVSNELQRLGKTVSVGNTDQQVHVTTIENDDAEYCLYDTTGAFTSDNVSLLRAAADEPNVQILMPIKTGKNDLDEVPFLLHKLNEMELKDRAKFVFTQVRPNAKSHADRKLALEEFGLSYTKWFMPLLEDFSERRDTARTRSEISKLLNEVIL